MKNRKRIALLTAAVLTGTLVLAGCGGEKTGDGGADSSLAEGSTEASAETLSGDLLYRVGFINLDNSDPNTYPAMVLFQEYVESDSFAEEVGHKVEAITADSAMDTERQTTNVENLLTKGVDMIFMIGVDTEANTAAVEACNAENVPVFMVGTEASGGEWRFAGFDEVDFGKTQGTWCAENLDKDAKICLLTCMPGREVTVKRQEGFEEGIASRDDLELVSVQSGDSSTETAMQVTEDWITSMGDEIDCIVAMDNIMAQGVVEALAQNGLSDKVAVVGYVGSTEDAQTIKDGSIDAAVFCYWPSIGTLCGEIVKDMYQGVTVPERSNIELYGMDNTNVDQLLEEVIG